MKLLFNRLSTNLFTPDGRINRKEFVLFHILCYVMLFFTIIIAGTLERISGNYGIFLTLGIFFLLLVLIQRIFINIRRFHDIDRSGWWLLLYLIGLGFIIFIFLCFLEGTPGPNKYGEQPQ